MVCRRCLKDPCFARLLKQEALGERVRGRELAAARRRALETKRLCLKCQVGSEVPSSPAVGPGLILSPETSGRMSSLLSTSYMALASVDRKGRASLAIVCISGCSEGLGLSR